MPDALKTLRTLFDRAVEVADPMQSLRTVLPPRPKGRLVILGAGKASARMAEAVEAEYGPCEGLVITRYGYARPCQGIEIVEAAHPVPDAAGAQATQRMLELAQTLTEDDTVLALISGGASALLVQPAGEITLQEKQQVNQALLSSGAAISQMNTVRKHLSRVKGGQLAAAAYPAQMISMMISDIPGDDPAMIGSGPTVGDNSTTADVLYILEQFKIDVSQNVQDVLSGKTGVIPPEDKRLSRVENIIYAAPSQSLAAAKEGALEQQIDVRVLGDAIEGEARDVARDHAALALDIRAGLRPGDSPVLLLSGGELTVTRRGDGIGGPNAEYALALALALNGATGIHALACDTDGVDGAAEVAGAVISPETLAQARTAGVKAEAALERNDAHSFFGAINGQVVTGPTLTNVNDFRAILIEVDY